MILIGLGKALIQQSLADFIEGSAYLKRKESRMLYQVTKFMLTLRQGNDEVFHFYLVPAGFSV